MCGIVGAIAERNVTPILIEGLRRLEYRGYDSAGVAVLDGGMLQRARRLGKVQKLQDALEQTPLRGGLGIAHTRWATHGAPSEANAHPHVSGQDLAIVHNGIIENHEQLRAELIAAGFEFTSETDTEVVAHRIRFHLNDSDDLRVAVQRTVAELEGAYALVVISAFEPDRLIVARSGCPLVIGLGIDENFVASDALALVPVTRRFVYLAEGDVAVVGRHDYEVFDQAGNPVAREVTESDLSADSVDRGPYRHFMLKEIHEQPAALANTLEERISRGAVLEGIFGHAATSVLRAACAVHFVACGNS
jgi:glutamine---fructose-6-phosphate transaminase (isomerizing)